METGSTAIWEDLDGSPAWQRLSDKQRTFLVIFLASAGNSLAAARGAYRIASAENHRAIAYQTLHNPAVKDALDLVGVEPEEHLGKPVSREHLVRDVRRAIRKAEPGSVAHSRLLAQLERLTVLEKPETPAAKEPTKADAAPKFTVGQIVTQKDAEGVVHRGKVLAVDENGKPTEVETLS